MTAEAIQPHIEPLLTGSAAPLRLGELLVQAGKLSARDLERALSAQQEMGSMLGRVVVQLGLVSEADVLRVLATQLGVPLVAADDFPAVPPEVDGLLPEFLAAHLVYPLRLDEGRLDVAMAVPQDTFIRKALHLATGLEIRPYQPGK